MKVMDANDALSVQNIVEMANKNRSLLDGTMAPLSRLIAYYDVVIAVWQDFEKPEGVGVLVIKGMSLLRDCATTGKVIDAKVTAIPCGTAEQAFALNGFVGDRKHLS